MKCSAWIRTCVDVFDHPLLDNGPFDRRSAWLWMIANANRFDRRINHTGKPVELKRGELLAGRKFLADKWGWSEQAVRTFTSALSADGMIKINQSNGHYANVITICNYDTYQTAPKKEYQSNNQCLTSAQPVSNQTLTEKQDNTISQDAGASEATIPEGFTVLGHGALINCETIRHPSFTISIPAVQMALALSNLQVDARQACSIAALQWAAAIEGGQPPHKAVPGNVTGTIVGGVRMGKFRELEHETRAAKVAAGPTSSGKRMDYASERIERAKALMIKTAGATP